jgi:hypothetical protein
VLQTAEKYLVEGTLGQGEQSLWNISAISVNKLQIIVIQLAVTYFVSVLSHRTWKVFQIQ